MQLCRFPMESVYAEYSTLDACIEDARRRTADPVLLATVEYLIARVKKAESDADKFRNELALLRERQKRDAMDRFVSDSESLNGERRPDAGNGGAGQGG